MLDRLKVSLYFWKNRFFSLFPKIMSKEKTVKLIIKSKLSVARFGDGEVKILLGRGSPKFQDFSEKLQYDLSKSFNTRKNNLLICLADICYDFPRRSDESIFYKKYAYYAFKDAKKLFDKRYFYGNTDITRFYHPALKNKTNFAKLEKYVMLLKQIWDKRNIVFVEGINTKLGVGNDLFDNALSIKRILCPNRNAYCKKAEIIKSIMKNCKNDDLVLLSLGPTASIIACEIAINTNLQVIDIGHIDVVYLWYKYKSDKIFNVNIKDVNEASENSGTINLDFDAKRYNSQILDLIEN